MNVFLRELTAYRKSTITWTISLSLMVMFFMGLFPAFTQDVEATREVLSSFPEAVRSALDISLDNFFSVNGFYAYLLSFAILSAAIQAMNAGTGVISKEMSGKTADFLLSKPITRVSVITAKLAAALTGIFITDVVFITMGYISASTASKEPFDAATFFVMSSTVFLVQLIFFALGALFAVSLPKIKSVVSVTLPTVFALYIVGMIGDVLENDSARYLSPFKYYDSVYIIEHSALETKYLVVEAAVVVVAVALSYVIFIKKDVRASA